MYPFAFEIILFNSFSVNGFTSEVFLFLGACIFSNGFLPIKSLFFAFFNISEKIVLNFIIVEFLYFFSNSFCHLSISKGVIFSNSFLPK